MNKEHPYGPNDLWQKNELVRKIEKLDPRDERAVAEIAKDVRNKRGFAFPRVLFESVKQRLGHEGIDPAVYSLDRLEVYVDKEKVPEEWQDIIALHEATELVYLVKKFQEKRLELQDAILKEHADLVNEIHANSLRFEYAEAKEKNRLDDYHAYMTGVSRELIGAARDETTKQMLEKQLREREQIFAEVKKS